MKITKVKSDSTEQVYVTRDEDSDIICVWRKPIKGIWAPQKLPKCEMVNWQRSDRNVEYLDMYDSDNFKKKFGITIRQKTKKCVHLDATLLHDDRFMLMTPLEKVAKYGKK